jgi:sphingomyelin phosphodiesterase
MASQGNRGQSRTRGITSAWLIAGILWAAFGRVASAETLVYVQNNTPFQFQVGVDQTGAALGGDKWRRGVSTLSPGKRDVVVRFNRDSGITDGQRFYFTTSLFRGGAAPLRLGQQLLGQTINSHLWQTLSGPGFSNPWTDDRTTRSGVWNFPDMSLRVLYRAFFTGTDDNIEYILQYTYPVEASDADTFSVLTYNVYMRPTSLFKNGQSLRARLLPPQLHGYDALIFSEAFDDDTRAELLNGLKPEYPYATSILGTDRGVEQDGGVVIVSRWPIVAQDERRFGGTCSGSDCQADKGVKYARIDRGGKIYNLFASHTQAWPTAEGANVRAQQFRIIKQFIDSKGISGSESVLIGGDLNVDRLKFPDEYRQMLQLLDAECPPHQGYAYTWDSTTNDLAEKTGTFEYLDYVLWSKAHLQPSQSLNEPRIVRSSQEWKEFGWEYAMWDLSDHYPVNGRFTFAQPFVGRFDMTFWSKQYLYAVNANGDLLWYANQIGIDRNAPGESPHDDKGVKFPQTTTNERRAGGLSDRVSATATVAGAARASASAAGTGRTSATVSNAAVLNPRLAVTPARGTVTELAREPLIIAQLAQGSEPLVYHQWEGPKRVGVGWGGFTAIYPAGLSGLYGLTPEGVLKWYRHDGFADGSFKWKGPVDVGTGWNSFKKIVAGGDGVLYGISPDGSLRWYLHQDVADAAVQPHWQGPNIVGNGWGNFVHVFSGGEGVIYAVDPQGTLLWYRHKGYLTGAADWEGPIPVGSGWAQFTRVFSPGDGNIYAVQPNGALIWYQHEGFRTGAVKWLKPVQIASGWNGFGQVFPRMWGTPVNNVH